MKKRRRRLFYQAAAFMLLFYILAAAISMWSMYLGSTRTYLDAKNEMIQRDLEQFIKTYISEETCPQYPWLFRYVREHRDEIPMEEEFRFDDTDYDYDQIYGGLDEFDPEIISERYSKAPADLQLYEARLSVIDFQVSIMMNMETADYRDMIIIVPDDGGGASIFCKGSLLKDGNEIKLGAGGFGESFELSENKHPAVMNVLNGSEDISFERHFRSGDEGKSLYVGCIPVKFKGEILAAVCFEYDYADFRSGLLKDMAYRGILMFVGLIICCGLTIFVIDRLAVKPLGKLKCAVKLYMDTRDSKAAAEQIDSISARNEIGALAGDIRDMTLEIDHHLSEYKTLSVEVMEALAHTIDAKDKYTNGHSTRVAIYSRMLAKKLGMSLEEQERIYNMGLLHDIGKIGVPSSIINKTTRLDDDEYAVIKTHPILGYEILSEIKSRPDLAIGARWHHERYDGRGYPDGLAGEDIPREARIIAVADCYDAMTSTRSYRSYLPQDVVRAEIEKNMGTQFDPEPAKAMLEIIDGDKNYMLHE